EIAGVKKELQSFATETIYSASDMASTYSQLAAVGIKSTKELVTGFGGLAAAAENPGQAMKTLSTQAVQMAAKPTVAWADFKLMLEQTPAGISAVAKHMGMSTAEMVTAVQDGKIATQDFFDAINAVGNNDTFRKMATE
ncbi:tape measure protein, partial [Streptococcus suis]